MTYQPKRLFEYTNEELIEALESMNKCIIFAQQIISVLGTIGSPGFEGDDARELLCDGITQKIENIYKEQGYALFVETYKIVYTVSDEIKLPPLIKTISVLSKKLQPEITWLYRKNYLYTSEVESEYESLSDEIKNKITNKNFFKTELNFDPTHQLVITKMLNAQLSSPRANEMLSYYILLLTEDLINDDGHKINIKDFKTNTEINSIEAIKKDIKNSVRNYYLKVKEKIEKNYEIPKKIDPKDDIWVEFNELLIKMQDVFIKIKDQHKDNFILYQQSLENKFNFEIFQFLDRNNILDKELFLLPSGRKLQKFKGGSALSKKITDNGTKETQEAFIKYMKEIIKYNETEVEMKLKLETPIQTSENNIK